MDKTQEQNAIENNDKTQEQPLIRSFKNQGMKSMYSPKIIGLLVAVVILGILSGFVLSGSNTSVTSSSPESSNNSNSSSVSKGTVVGSNDTKTFKDKAEGTLREGGIQGEGAYHLERSGGESQNVYMTSSSVDLSKFVGKKIKVWGQTQKAQYAGWLMDVGRVEVL